MTVSKSTRRKWRIRKAVGQKKIGVIILIERHFSAPPKSISVHEFGSESIWSVRGGELVADAGVSARIYGPPNDIKNWLAPYSRVWTSNNPMTGQWEQLDFKND